MFSELFFSFQRLLKVDPRKSGGKTTDDQQVKFVFIFETVFSATEKVFSKFWFANGITPFYSHVRHSPSAT